MTATMTDCYADYLRNIAELCNVGFDTVLDMDRAGFECVIRGKGEGNLSWVKKL